MLRQHAQEVERAAATVTRINAQTARQAEAQSRIQERVAKRLADEKIREGRRGLREIERQLAQEVRANRQAQQEIARAAAASQQRRSAFMAGAVGGVTALIGVSAISEIRNAASAWLDYASKLESTRIAFATMMGSAQLAEQHLKELQQFALTTPFQFGDLIDASQRMQALGFNASQVIPILTDVGNAVAAAGGGAERLDRVVLALSQMQSKGKVATQELNQLAESGISGWKILEAQLGKSRAELVKMVEAGQISSKVFLDAFQKFSQQNFGGLMEAQSKTFSGAMSNIKDALLQTSATAFAPLYARLSQLAQEMSTASMKSTEFKDNMIFVGRQLVHVFDGVVEAVHILRDVVSVFSAYFVQLVVFWTEVVFAVVHAFQSVYHAAQSVARLMAGDFVGAIQAAQQANIDLNNSIESTSRAVEAEGIVVRRLGDIWTEAGARANQAALNMQAAASIMAAAAVIRPPWEVGQDLLKGITTTAQKTASAGEGGGGGGKGKKAKVDNTARDAFRAETQALRDAISERASAYREETAKIKSEYDQRLTDFASHITALNTANKGRFDATIALITQEETNLENAHARKLVKDDEYTKRHSDLQKDRAKATADFNVEEARIETESYQHRIQLQEQFDTQRAAMRDQNTADTISDLTRLRDIAIEDSEIAIADENKRAKAILDIELEYNKQVKTLRLQQVQRERDAIYAEVRAIAERLAEVKKISIEEAMASKVVTDALAERANKIEATEKERQRIIKGASDANIDAYRKEAAALAAAKEAASADFRSAAKGAQKKVAKAGGWQLDPPDTSLWGEALGAIEERMQNFHVAAQMYVVDAFHNMADAATDAIQAWILYGGSLGKALKQALAAELAAIAARAAIQAALHAAYAIGSLAFGNFAAAAQHGLAAAKFAAVAALTGIAARGLASSAAASQSGGVTAGSAFQSATRTGSGSTAGQPTTIDVNRPTGSNMVFQPTIHVTVNGQATEGFRYMVEKVAIQSARDNGPFRKIQNGEDV